MNIAVFGLGYVGSVSMACFANDGHNVIGVDINQHKVEAINKGTSPIIEPGLEALLESGLKDGRIKATINAAEALKDAEVALVCVGTPSKPNGSLDITFIERVCKDIANELSKLDHYIVVAIRSTILPCTAQDRIIPLIEAESGKTAGRDFGFSVNPEFLREGSAISDFYSPPFSVVGELDERSGERIAALYAHIDAPIYHVPLGEAEMIKYASNAFHALKVVFANEIGNICQIYRIDSHKVMEIFVKDSKLNLSPNYLKPGFAFGGSCLGKDLRALLHAARQRDLDVPLLQSILPSNTHQIQKAVTMVQANGSRKVGIIGLSFKKNTDDLRESPILEMAEQLIGKGFDIRIYDREVTLSQLQGSNREHLEKTIPHITSLMRSTIQEALEDASTIVVSKKLSKDEQEELKANIREDQTLIDLVRLDGQEWLKKGGFYRGICW